MVGRAALLSWPTGPSAASLLRGSPLTTSNTGSRQYPRVGKARRYSPRRADPSPNTTRVRRVRPNCPLPMNAKRLSTLPNQNPYLHGTGEMTVSKAESAETLRRALSKLCASDRNLRGRSRIIGRSWRHDRSLRHIAVSATCAGSLVCSCP